MSERAPARRRSAAVPFAGSTGSPIPLIWLGPLLTLGVLALIVIGRSIIPVSSPGVLLLLTVAVAAVLGGVAPALVSAAITVLFAAVDASAPGALFQYTSDNLSRLAVNAIVAPAMAVLVGTIEARLQVARSESARRLSDERQRALTQTSSDAVITADIDGVIRSANPAAALIYGYPVNELMGSPMARLAPDARRAQFGEDLRRYFETGTAPPQWQGREATARHSSGREIPIEVSFGVYGAGADRRISWIIRDISARKQLQAQVLQASKMDAIGRLAGGVAHDFNNILTAIVGNAALLADTVPEGDDRELVHNIEDAAARATGLTRQLLAFGRRQMLEPRVIDVSDAVSGIGALLRRIVGEDIDFQALTSKVPSRVFADPTQLEQVIVNLAVNAREAMPKGGRLTIEVASVELDDLYTATHPEVTPGAYVLLAVSDTGAGMDAETQAKIFEPFFTTKSDAGGTGLGLATVYGIVRQSGGSINVYSEVGRGTVFKVYLPQVVDPVATKDAVPAPDVPRGGGTILVAEDDEAVRGITVMTLGRQGYRVLAADGGTSALALATAHEGRIDLLVTDVVMGGMSGLDLARQLQAVRPEIRTLYVSGYTENTIVHHGVVEAGISFLAKPFTPVSLARKVAEVMAH
jgi:two-component system cell cycle sensor histidine kinase/response regulator CckA